MPPAGVNPPAPPAPPAPPPPMQALQNAQQPAPQPPPPAPVIPPPSGGPFVPEPQQQPQYAPPPQQQPQAYQPPQAPPQYAQQPQQQQPVQYVPSNGPPGLPPLQQQPAPQQQPPQYQPQQPAPQQQYIQPPEHVAPQQYVPQPQPAPQYQPQQQMQAPAGGIGGEIAQLMSQQQGSTGVGAFLNQWNLNEVADSNFRLIPDDIVYESVIVKVEPSETNNKDPMLVITLKTVHPSPHQGVTLMDYLPILANTLWRYKSFLRAAEQLDDAGMVKTQQWSDFNGFVVRHALRHDEYPQGSGQMRNKINGAYSPAYEAPGLSGGQQQKAPAPYQPQQPAPQYQPQQQGAPQPNWGQRPGG